MHLGNEAKAVIVVVLSMGSVMSEVAVRCAELLSAAQCAAHQPVTRNLLLHYSGETGVVLQKEAAMIVAAVQPDLGEAACMVRQILQDCGHAVAFSAARAETFSQAAALAAEKSQQAYLKCSPGIVTLKKRLQKVDP